MYPGKSSETNQIQFVATGTGSSVAASEGIQCYGILSFGRSECKQLMVSLGFVVRRGKDANYVMGTHGGLQGWVQLLLDD